MDRAHYPRATRLLTRELLRRPGNAVAQYARARYYFDVLPPRRNLDSAYHYALGALRAYPSLPARERTFWQKRRVTDATLARLKGQLDSLGFVAAQDSSTAAAYQSFLDRFPTAAQAAEATRRRDALAFAQARRAGTYEAYRQFAQTYPNAAQLREATELADLLLFERQTAVGTAAQYAAFAAAYPASPYRDRAERAAFLLSCAPHTPGVYQAFLTQYPGSAYAPRARAWLRFFAAEARPPDQFAADLAKAQTLTYFPVVEAGKYGFMDEEGTLRIPATCDSTDRGYFCEGITEDFIRAWRGGRLGALDKTGQVIADFAYAAIEALDPPLLRVTQAGRQGVVHEGGFVVLPPQFDSVEAFSAALLKIYRNGRQGLVTVNGLSVLEPVWEEIANLQGDFVTIGQGGRYALLAPNQLTPGSDRRPVVLPPFEYAAVEWARQGCARVTQPRNGQPHYAILGDTLQPLVPWQSVAVEALPRGWRARANDGTRLWTLAGTPLRDSLDQPLLADRVFANEAFFAVKYRGHWGAWTADGRPRLPCAYDTLALLPGRALWGQQKRSTWLFPAVGPPVSLGTDPLGLTATPADPTNPAGRYYLVAENEAGKRGLYTAEGRPTLPFWYEAVRVLAPNLFAVEAGGKVGLKDSLNQLLLPLVYDGLNAMPAGGVATLKDGRFGAYYPSDKRPIPPQYEVLLQPYDRAGTLLVARLNGKLGLVDRQNRPRCPFRFDDLRYWRAGVALVRENNQWHLFDFASNRYSSDSLDDIAYVRQDATEIILRTYAHNQYGILSNVRGPVVPTDYTDLTNVGSAEKPFYLAARRTPGTDGYVVSYLGASGQLLHQQLLSEAAYEDIACE